MKTTEGNRLIAEFMGAYIAKEGQQAYDMDNKFPNGKDRQMPDKMLYHSSWDWLMPVVEKIEGLFFVTSIQYSQKYYWVDIAKHPQLFHPNENSTYEVISVKSASSKIIAVWLAVIEFIQKTNKKS